VSLLHLVRVPVVLPQLGRWAALRNYGFTIRRRANGQQRDAGFDEGRALHHLLAETFGPGVLHPFRHIVAPDGIQAQLYAYGQQDATALLEVAHACALPEVSVILDLAQLATKAMPQNWHAGRHLGFELRVRPVSRLLKPLECSGAAIPKGAEVDAFLVEALRRFPTAAAEENMLQAGRSREAVYTDWLAQRLSGAATLRSGVRLTRFQRVRAARKGYSPEGPDAILQGDLTVDNPVRFQQLLTLGIGRHKAYGYGMLLLRPSRSL
jgi:CRISPR system Cascade subunit CasE